MSALSSLHEQLDVIEQLRATALQGSPESRLQGMCQTLYGERVPDSWAAQALTAPVKPECALTVPAFSHLRKNFRAFKAWGLEAYQRQKTRAAWEERQALNQALHDHWDKLQDRFFMFTTFCLFATVLVPMTMLFAGVSEIFIVSSFMSGFFTLTFASQRSLRLNAPLMEAKKQVRFYGKVSLSKKKVNKWCASPAVATLLLDLLESSEGVPLLKGDLPELKKLQTYAHTSHMMSQARQSIVKG